MVRDRMKMSIEIKVPPEKVWELLTWDRVQEGEEGYRKNLKNMRYASEVRSLEDKYEVCTTAHLILKQGESDLEITESVQNEKIAFHSKGKGMNAIITYLLEPTVEGTKFTYMVDYEIPLGIGRGLSRLLKGSGEREVKRSLSNLKTFLEQ